MIKASSPWLGSGVLDIMSRLKESEANSKTRETKAVEAKVKDDKKDESSSALNTALTAIREKATALTDDSHYSKRVAASSSSDVEIALTGDATPQDSTINVSRLAQNHIVQSGRYASPNAAIATTYDPTFRMSVNGQSYTIDLKAGDTLQMLAQKINDVAGGAVTASLMDTGAAKNPYVMVLKGSGVGSPNKISIDSSFDAGLVTKKTLDSTVAAGSLSVAEGELTVNGVSISMAATKETNTSADNALAIARAINTKTAETGVRAYTYLTETDGVRKIGFKNHTGGEINVTSSETLNALLGKTLDTDGDNDATTTKVSARALQEAKDSEFTFNGEVMNRPSNELTDVIAGATIKLNKVTTADVNLSVSKDLTELSSLADEFVTAFNSSKGKASAVNEKLLSLIGSDSDGIASLAEYGFALDSNNALTLDKTKLDSKLAGSQAEAEALLKTAFAEIAAVAVNINEKEDDKDKEYKDKDKKDRSIRDKKDKHIRTLEDRFERAMQNFGAYDNLIGKLQQTLLNVKEQIDSFEDKNKEKEKANSNANENAVSNAKNNGKSK